MNCLRTSRRQLLSGLLLSWLGLVPAAHAHEARPAYLEITETAPGRYSVLWRTPVKAGKLLPVVLCIPEEVQEVQEPVSQLLSDSRLERRWIDAGQQGLHGKRIDFAGLQLTITDVVVRVKLLDGRTWLEIAKPAQPWVKFEATHGTWATALDFLQQGFEHILSGPDHLLFVLGLLLIVRTAWTLVKTITAFTVAHSITLAAATLGYVQPPRAPIEAAIALSILFLGPEIIRARRGTTSFTIRHPWVVAFAFGLLHGFGFASVMSAAGLPPAAVPLALVSFNVGVELGQLVFVGLVLLLELGVRVLKVTWPRPVALAPAYVVGSVGAFWVFQRVALMV